MASLNVNPEYDIDMEQLTPETRAHADRFNERYGQLLGNDAFLKGKLEEANTSIERAMAVAQGKSAGLVFNTYAELIAYIAVPANAEKFRLGDQFLIKAMDVPDYWWDNTVTTEQTDIEGNVISAKNSSGKVIGALVELEARKVDLSKYDENDAALFDNMSDRYSASRTYDVGDICIYDNNLYKCVTAVETAETFDQAKWNKTSFAALHADQEKKISENTQSLIDKSMNALFTVKTHGDLTTSGYYTLTSIPKNFGSNDIYVDQYGDIIFKKTGHYMLNISLVLDKNFASTLADISVHRYDSTGGSDTLISEHYFYAANNVHTGNVNILIPITAYGYLKIYCFGKVQGGYISLYRVE